MSNSNPKVVVLTDDEWYIVKQHRKQVKAAAERAKKQKECEHEWRYAGHGHNDDCYECRKCGSSKWV